MSHTRNTNDYLNAENTERFKRQATSVKPQAEKKSPKPLAPSSKPQAPSRKQQAPEFLIPHKVSSI